MNPLFGFDPFKMFDTNLRQQSVIARILQWRRRRAARAALAACRAHATAHAMPLLKRKICLLVVNIILLYSFIKNLKKKLFKDYKNF